MATLMLPALLEAANDRELNDLVHDCLKSRTQNIRNTIITNTHVQMFCRSQSMQKAEGNIQRRQLPRDAVLYILELYRKIVHRTSGSDESRIRKRQEVRTLSRSQWNNFASKMNLLKNNMVRFVHVTYHWRENTFRWSVCNNHGMTLV